MLLPWADGLACGPLLRADVKQGHTGTHLKAIQASARGELALLARVTSQPSPDYGPEALEKVLEPPACFLIRSLLFHAWKFP